MGKGVGYLHTVDQSAVTVKHRVVAELVYEHILIIKGGAVHMMFILGGPWLMLFGETGVRQIILVALVGGVLRYLFRIRIT